MSPSSSIQAVFWDSPIRIFSACIVYCPQIKFNRIRMFSSSKSLKKFNSREEPHQLHGRDNLLPKSTMAQAANLRKRINIANFNLCWHRKEQSKWGVPTCIWRSKEHTKKRILNLEKNKNKTNLLKRLFRNPCLNKSSDWFSNSQITRERYCQIWNQVATK